MILAPDNGGDEFQLEVNKEKGLILKIVCT